MTPDLPSLVLILIGVVISVIGFFLVRVFKQVDSSLALLTSKVDGLASQDTQIQIAIMELRTRITNLEFVVHHKNL